jgi:hypothetical protein
MRILILLPLLCLTNVSLFAQPKLNSPYSKYGIGDPVNQFFATHAGWGGQVVASHDPFHLNIVNPASFAFLRSTALEVGLFAKRSHLNFGNSTNTDWSGNMANVALGFTLKSPINEALDKIKSPWSYGMGFALTPYTLVGYNVQTIDTLPDLGIVENSFVGSGGTYRFGWSGGAKYKNTAFGLNLGWIFGNTEYENTTVFEDSLPTFIDTRRQSLHVNGLVWSIGAQRDFVLEFDENEKSTPTRWVIVGLTAEGKQTLGMENDNLFLRNRGVASNGQYIDADTFISSIDLPQKLTLPAKFGLGFQYVEANKLKIGAQFDYGAWSAYRNEARPEEMRNTFSVSGGMEYIPDFSSYNRYGKRIRYRAGAYYRQDPRMVDGKGLNDFGLSFGVGFPIILPRQQTSFINTALEIGRLGDNTPIEETYFRFTVGFTLNDNTWFYKRRFE